MLALTLTARDNGHTGWTAPLMWRKTVVKKTLVAAAAISLSTFALSSCGSSDAASGSDGSDDGTITMGFAQVGAESGWRTANTKSIQDTAADEGIDLKFTDA